MIERFIAAATRLISQIGQLRRQVALPEPAAHDEFHHTRNRQKPKRRTKSNRVKRNRRRNELAFESRRRNWQ